MVFLKKPPKKKSERQENEEIRKRIRKICDNLFETHKTRDPFMIAQQLGIKVYLCELNSLPACCFANGRDATIFISNNYTSYAKRVLCAHELGHLLMHREQGILLFDSKMCVLQEYEANCFAVNLISQFVSNADPDSMSRDELNSYMESKIITLKRYGEQVLL